MPPYPKIVIKYTNNNRGCTNTCACSFKRAGRFCLRFLGTSNALPISAITPNAETTKKVARQPKCCPIQVPSGTPVTNATVNPVNIIAMALASFSLLTKLVAMVEPIEKNTPCARPVNIRAIIKLS